MNRANLRDYITINEGLRLSVFLDTLGNSTIGVGFNLEKADAIEKISELGLCYYSLKSGVLSFTIDQAMKLLEEDIDNSVVSATLLFCNFHTLSRVRQIVLTDMAFNLGQTRLSRFVNLIAEVKAENWEKASREMQNSAWANQVGRRGRWNIHAMRSNHLPNYYSELPKDYLDYFYPNNSFMNINSTKEKVENKKRSFWPRLFDKIFRL